MAPTRRHDEDDVDHGRRTKVLVSVAVATVIAVGVGGWWVSRANEPSAAAFCSRLADLTDLDAVLLGDADEIAQGHRDLVAALAVAPPEIAADAQVVSDAVGLLAERAQLHPQDPQAGIDAGLIELQPHIATVTAASQSLGAWSATTCGLELAGTGVDEEAPAVTTTVPTAPLDVPPEQAAAG